MKTRQQLQFDFDTAINQAKRLESLAGEIESTVARPLGSSAQELAAAWKGNSATAYVEKQGRLKEKISDTASDLRTVAEEIRAAAQRVYEAEMKAICIARSAGS